MAFGRLERRDLPKPMGEINMTPLIDVMLVLLVIFMITAPLMSSSLRLDLPKSEAATPSAPSSLMTGSLSVIGFWLVDCMKVDPIGMVAQPLADLVRLVASGEITPLPGTAPQAAPDAPARWHAGGVAELGEGALERQCFELGEDGVDLVLERPAAAGCASVGPTARQYRRRAACL